MSETLQRTDAEYADLSGFQRDLLAVIAGAVNPKGTALKARLAEYRAEEINHGRLYPNLDDLVERGLVEKGQIDRRTNSYTLTARGERALRERQEFVAEMLEGEI